MRLTKDGQRAYDQMKREGYTDEEMAEYVFPMEYESDEERKEVDEEFKKCREKAHAKLTLEEIQKINELAERLRKEDENKGSIMSM